MVTASIHALKPVPISMPLTFMMRGIAPDHGRLLHLHPPHADRARPSTARFGQAEPAPAGPGVRPRGTVRSGDPRSGELLADLARRSLFTERREGTPPAYTFHALFGEFLRARAADTLTQVC